MSSGLPQYGGEEKVSQERTFRMIIEKPYASESARWYTREGRPIESVTGVNGVEKKPTLREARKGNWIPSVTTILQVMAKPELEAWKMREVAKMCENFPVGELESQEEYVSTVIEAAKLQMSKARDVGSEVHSDIDRMLLEKNTKGYLPDEYPLSAHTEAARNALIDLGVWGQRMEVERSFCGNGVAGKVDLKGVQSPWIVDWKTTSKPLDDGKVPDYDEYLAQMSAYSMGVFGKLVPCRNVFLSTLKWGSYAIREWTEAELDWGWQLFCDCRALWMTRNRYYYL